MRISCQVERRVHASPHEVFALATDAGRFAPLFRGCGPIPALRSVELDGALRVGAVRRLHNSDGSRAREQVTALVPGALHAYRLEGLAAPFAWLVRHGDARWDFDAVPAGTHVRWRYDFELTSPLAAPVAWPLLHGFMARAMRGCLARLDAALAPVHDAAGATP